MVTNQKAIDAAIKFMKSGEGVGEVEVSNSGISYADSYAVSYARGARFSISTYSLQVNGERLLAGEDHEEIYEALQASAQEL